MTAKEIQDSLRKLGDPKIAEHSLRYFKTGKGEYGEHDSFLGIRMPVLRAQVKKYRQTPLKDISRLLKSAYHEGRMFALLLLVSKFQSAAEEQKKDIYELYLSHTMYINNWDLVDCSAHLIVGPYLQHKDRKKLYQLADSPSLWERRIAILSTLHFIRQADFYDALRVSEALICDKEDLIHKAVGWMLREVGNRDRRVEDLFLIKHCKEMPRTMLRYAIEKYPEEQRQRYLKGLV